MLITTVGALRCVLPLSCVVETMRPLPIRPIAGAPAFVAGAAVIRGGAVPVVDVATLLGAPPSAPARLVVVRAGDHHVALAVDAVEGIHDGPDAFLSLPPLLSRAGASAVTALGTLDRHLLVVLEAAQIVPDALWATLSDVDPS
jgi:purine-binding chemotaxis protein CheW